MIIFAAASQIFEIDEHQTLAVDCLAPMLAISDCRHLYRWPAQFGSLTQTQPTNRRNGS
jgi:hypothetical protein